MTTQFLTLRLTAEDASLMEHLRAQTGLRKSNVVKRALRHLMSSDVVPTAGGLFALGDCPSQSRPSQ